MHRPRFLLFVFFAMTSSLMAQSLFAPVVTHYSGGQVASSVIVVDVNGDGKPDLVVSNECENSNTCGNGTVGVLLGNGDGTFQKAATFQSGGYGSVTVAATDVNSDGLPDLLVASVCASSSNCPSGIITLLLGNGDGTFQNAALVATYGSGQNATFSMTVADVNGDGKPDLLVSNQCESGSNCAGKVGVLLGNGDGSFQGAVTYDSGGSGALGVAVGDVNGDGKPDLLVANICPSGGESCNANGSVGVLLGNGDGTFQQPLSFGSGGQYADSVELADVNADGKPDLLVANGCADSVCSSGSVGVLLGYGSGQFQQALAYSSGGYGLRTPGGAGGLAVRDVNGDGIPDLIVSNRCADIACQNGSLGVLLGIGDGAFQSALTFNSGGLYPDTVAVADVNGDSKPDLLVGDYYPRSGNGGRVGVLLNKFKATTTTNLTSSLNPSLINQTVTFTATITASSSIPNGSAVTFYAGGSKLGTSSTINGVATLTTSFSKAKPYPIKASYTGDPFHKASSGTVAEVVTLYPSTTTVTSSPNPSTYGQAVTLTATVSSSAPGGPTGRVVFKSGTTTLGTKTLSAGTATLTTTKLPRGTLTITAKYNGDTQTSKSSGMTTQTVN